MTIETETQAEPALVTALMQATPAEQRRLLEWSRGLGAIRLRSQPWHRKALAIVALTREQGATWPLLKLLGRVFRHILWDARSWKLRLGVLAIFGTFAAVGSGAASQIVPLGAGLGLPLWILAGTAGTLAGAVADWLRRRSPRTRIP